MADLPKPFKAGVLDGTAHGFFGRCGGVSTGVVAGLNAGFGADDDGAAVAANRAMAANGVLPGAALVTPYQIHSPDVAVVTAAWKPDERPRADALVTDRSGLLLGIVTADCAPILLADREAGVIGAAHAGWKGALSGVAENTVDAMESLGADRSRICAAIGPCIARASYEVDEGFRENFGPDDDDQFFVRGRPGHFHFDLEAYVVARLRGCGIGHVESLGLDTYADEARFYSYRRATHRSEATYGRQISLIGLKR